MDEAYHRIQAALAGTGARLIAVSKGQPLEKIEALYRLGQRDFGENYVQELLAKSPELAARGLEGIRWHFIGHLQTNKVRALVPIVQEIHAVDSLRLAEEISRRSQGAGKRLPVLIEVNLEAEPSKSGITPEALGGLAEALSRLPGVELRGLMCIPSREGGLSGEAFRRLRALRDAHSGLLGPGELSMGMSEDFEVAAREGSTWVRVGTALFGPRKA